MKTKGLVFEERIQIGDVAPTTYEDESRYGNDGAITGATWSQEPSGLWVLNFDGTNTKYVNIPNSPSLKFGTGDFSMDVWFKTTGSAGQVLIGTVDGADPWINFELIDDDLRVFLDDSNSQLKDYLSVGEGLNDGNWYNGAFTFAYGDAGGQKLFINGAEVGTYNKSVDQNHTGNFDVAVDYKIGIDNRLLGDNAFDGKMALLRVYHYARSAEQIAARYSATKHWFGK